MNQKLNDTYNLLAEQKNEDDRSYVKQKLLSSSFEEIEQITLDELNARDFEGAALGLRILIDLKPSALWYKTALGRLQNKDLLLDAMEQNGLPKSSPLFQQQYAGLFSSTDVQNI
jgi:hypothetical protein